MLWRYVSHIPARHFKMVRYYGFLANRKRGIVDAESLRSIGDDATRKAAEAGVRCADESVPGHRSVSVHSLQRPVAFCRRHGGRARHKNAL